MEENSHSYRELVYKALGVFLTAWNIKMSQAPMLRGNAKAPVLDSGDVNGWLHNLQPDNRPGENNPSGQRRYDEIEQRIGNKQSGANIAKRLNDAIMSGRVLDNLRGSMHWSLIGMLLNDKTLSDKSGETKKLHTSDTSMYEGQTYWFTLKSIADKYKNDYNKLNGGLCTYMMYDSHDVSGGRTGKVIVCPTRAGNVEGVAQRLADIINRKLMEVYHTDKPYAVVKPLDQIEYNVSTGEGKPPKVIRGIKGTGMNIGIDIDCSERIDVDGALVDPRVAVSRLFKDGLLPIQTFSVETTSTKSTEDRLTSQDTDDDKSLATKVDANIAAGHAAMSDSIDNSDEKAKVAALVQRMGEMPKRIALLNGISDNYLDGFELDTSWAAVPFKLPPMSNDAYLNLVNTVTALSDYIISSTADRFSDGYKPVAYDGIFMNRNIRFATNEIPRGKESITLEKYAETMNAILDGCENAASQPEALRLIKSARMAVGAIKSFEENVFKLISGNFKPYTKDLDVKEIESKRKATELADKYQNAMVSVKKMDALTGFPLTKVFSGMVKPTMTLDSYLNNAMGWMQKTADQQHDSDQAMNQLTEKFVKLVEVNTALNSLLNGNSKTAPNAVKVLDNILASAAPDAEPQEQSKPQPAPAEKPTEPQKPSTEAPKPVEKPTEEPKSEPAAAPEPEPKLEDDDDLDDIDEEV